MRMLTILLIFLSASNTWSQDPVNPQQAFYRGREFFDKSDFGQAIQAYKSALRTGESKELLFNLGTACLFAGRNGEALYYLLRAEELAPRDEDIERNIAVARSRAKDDIKSHERTKFVRGILYLHERTTFAESLTIFACCYLLAMLLLHLRLLRAGKWFTRIAAVLLLVGTAMGYSLIVRASADQEPSRGVILGPVVDVFSGPSDHTYSVFFKLHAAAEVDVLEIKGGWVKVAVDDKKGYVPANQIGLL